MNPVCPSPGTRTPNYYHHMQPVLLYNALFTLDTNKHGVKSSGSITRKEGGFGCGSSGKTCCDLLLYLLNDF